MGMLVMSCHNKYRDFPDFEYQTVYFAYQYPVRTITLGEDVFDTELDNQYKCKIVAATGGVYSSKKDVHIGINVDRSLLGNGLLFRPGGDEVLAMPDNYFSLAGNEIVIPKGELAGGVEVQLSDAFFADAKSIKNTYVIPLRMTNKGNADSVLAGKDFILYAIKYVNEWHGNYLRRGKDVVTGDLNTTITRHAAYVEDDQVNKLSTNSLTTLDFPVVVKNKDGINVTCPLRLNFNSNGECTITSNGARFTATGTGKFVKRGEKKSWGDKDRDALYLNYTVNLLDHNISVATMDTLVMRDRAVTMEVFTPVTK